MNRKETLVFIQFLTGIRGIKDVSVNEILKPDKELTDKYPHPQIHGYIYKEKVQICVSILGFAYASSGQ